MYLISLLSASPLTQRPAELNRFQSLLLLLLHFKDSKSHDGFSNDLSLDQVPTLPPPGRRGIECGGRSPQRLPKLTAPPGVNDNFPKGINIAADKSPPSPQSSIPHVPVHQPVASGTPGVVTGAVISVAVIVGARIRDRQEETDTIISR